jgi:hypothetical protein
MTENDWADHCFKVRTNPQELKLSLLVWADHVEEQGLGYEKGLRLLSNHTYGPRAPWDMGKEGGNRSFSNNPGFVWCSSPGSAPSHLERDTKPLLKGHHIENHFSWHKTCLEAYRDACLAVESLEGIPR